MITPKAWLSEPRILCGLMSGTSLDGVDAALIRCTPGAGAVPSLEVLSFCTLPLPEELLELTREIISRSKNVDALSLAHTAFASVFADAVRAVCDLAGLPLEAVDAIGSHGQTVWHQPLAQHVDSFSVASTLQIGSPSALAQLTGIPVVADFRPADVAVGGQGAPLVPLFDYHFFSRPDRDVVALNIGGMANITLLPAGVQAGDIRAFDTGPGNVLIDLSTLKFFGKRFDTNGSIARDGLVLPRLLATLKKEPFIAQEPPKSTGRELFTMEYLDRALEYNYMSTQPAEDPVRTVTEFTAWSIAENIRLFGKPDSLVVASGGGTKNPVLMQILARELPEAQIVTSDELGISSDAKEAICFAYLAYRTLGGLPGNIPSVTGAAREVTLGVVALP